MRNRGKSSKNSRRMSPEEYCPVRQTIKVLGKRWTILIIKELYYSRSMKLSFMDLRRRLPDVSTKVLSERLKEMTDNRLINRRENTDVKPIRVSYTLTQKGKDACKIIEVFKEYGLKWGGKETFNCEDISCELCPKKKEN